jgi:DNA-binding CsgD family transcriptional regulator/PAS domain-containing protein
MRLLHDTAHLAATIGAIYDCVLEPARWQDLMPRLAAEVGARSSYLGVTTANGQLQQTVVATGLPPIEEMSANATLSPFLPIGLVWPLDKPYVVSRDYDPDALKRSRYWRDYLVPNRFRDAVMGTVVREGDSFGHWMLITHDDRDVLTSEEVAGVELIAPHLRRAVEISRVLGVQRLEAETYRAALGHLESPVLILDERRWVMHANPRAEALLEQGTVLRRQKGRLLGATEEVERLVRRVGEDAAMRGAAGLEATVTGADGEAWLLFAVILDRSAERVPGQAAGSVMLVLRSPRRDTHNPISIAARVFGLTPAQVQVLAFLAQGHPPEEIAAILGVSISTVRSHLRDLFGRTGTTRQAELVARTLSLASPLRSATQP